MAAVTQTLAFAPLSATRVSRRSSSAFVGAPLEKRAVAVRAARASQVVRASAEQKEQQVQLPAAVFTLAATLSQAGAADAAVSPSLKNLLLSVLAGGSVLLVIAVGVVAVSTFDKVTRKG